jgi:hypothetical protein
LSRKKWYHIWKAEGKCVSCGGILDTNKIFCVRCLEYRKEYRRRWRRRLKEKNPERYKEYLEEQKTRHKEWLEQNDTRKPLREKLGNKCFVCGYQGQLVLHEKNFNKHPPTPTYYGQCPDDFILVCRTCHNALHRLHLFKDKLLKLVDVEMKA